MSVIFFHPKASDLPCFWKRLDLKYAGRETAARLNQLNSLMFPSAQGGPALFLPQLLHVLALHMKQAEREIFLFPFLEDFLNKASHTSEKMTSNIYS